MPEGTRDVRVPGKLVWGRRVVNARSLGRIFPLCLLLCLILLFGMIDVPHGALAWEPVEFEIPWFAGYCPESLQRFSDERFSMVAGEVVAVVADAAGLRMAVRTDDELRVVVVAGNAEVFRNGRRVSLLALRPVGLRDFHEAYVLLNSKGEAIYVEGFYVSAEVRVIGINYDARLIEVAPMDAPQARKAFVIDLKARVMRGPVAGLIEEIKSGDSAFIVLNLAGKVKTVYVGI